MNRWSVVVAIFFSAAIIVVQSAPVSSYVQALPSCEEECLKDISLAGGISHEFWWWEFCVVECLRAAEPSTQEDKPLQYTDVDNHPVKSGITIS